MILNDQIMQLEITLKMRKLNYLPKKTKSNDINVHKIQQKKTRIEIVGDSTVKGIEEIICRTDIKQIAEKINETNSHFESYCKQQNLSFINNSKNNKSGVAAKGLHLKERGSTKLAKNFVEYVY